MNTHQNSKLVGLYKNSMQDEAKFPGSPAGIFLKIYFREFLKREFPVAYRSGTYRYVSNCSRYFVGLTHTQLT